MSFDEQPDGDIHGECAAEIEKLVRELRIQAEHFERAWQLRGDGIDRLRSQISAGRPTKQRPVSVISAIGPQPVVLVKKSNTGHPTPTTKEIQHGKFE
jgi:hypothetical protein